MPGSRAGARVPGIQAVVQLIHSHRGSIAVTLRGYGVGLSDLGDGVTWGEAKTLLEEAAADGATPFGAELAGWAYPASIPQLLSLVAQVGDWKAAKKVMPWAMEGIRKRTPQATAAEVAAADAALEAEIVFT